MRGIFLCLPQEIRWFYQEGASWMFPDVWEKYRDAIPEAERGDFVSAYYKRLTGGDERARVEAARAWSVWEGSTSKLFYDPALVEKFDEPEFALAFARIECHYFMNNAFFPTDNYLIENVGKIRHIPAVIVQGRYDVVCPMRSAWELHRAWPEADFQAIAGRGDVRIAGLRIRGGFSRSGDNPKHAFRFFFRNEYYRTHEDYVFAIAEALREEYLEIINSGLILQVDDAVLANMYDYLVQQSPERYREWAQLRVDALNHALRGLPGIYFHSLLGSRNDREATAQAFIADVFSPITAAQWNSES